MRVLHMEGDRFKIEAKAYCNVSILAKFPLITWLIRKFGDINKDLIMLICKY